MPSSRSNRRAAIVAMQSMVGILVLAGWVILSQMLFEDDMIHVLSGALPYFLTYELGIFSRYLPGLSTFARRFE